MPASASTPQDAAVQDALRARGLSRHIAMIMDGNGRWAKGRGRSRVHGHREGVVSVRDVVEACAELGVEVVTLYTFSTENWHRPVEEVGALMELLVRTLRREAARLDKNDIRLRAIGDLSRLPERCRNELEESIAMTASNERMTLNLALSYSGRWDITQAVRQIADQVAAGSLHPDQVSEEMLSTHLTTAGLPDPDLLIRTGGEQRISNFLLWEAAYAELYFTDVYWPDFRREALYEAIRTFQHRERRFGRVGEARGAPEVPSDSSNKALDPPVRAPLA